MVANGRSPVLKLFGWFLLACLANSQIRFLTLEQAGSRTGANLAAAYEGEEVAVVGQVSARAFWASDTLVIPVQDSSGVGLLIEGSAFQIESFGPGDWIQARGVIATHSGAPMLTVRDVQKYQTLPPPAPRTVLLSEINSDRYSGVLIATEGVVTRFEENRTGDLLTIGDTLDNVDVFLSKGHRSDGRSLNAFRPGDRVRLTGIASQYCTDPPYNHGYRVLLPDAADIGLIGRSSPWSSRILLAALLFIAGLLMTWWVRERRMSAQRGQLRALNQLVEETIAALSPAEIMNKLNTEVPTIWPGSSVSLYLYNRGSKLLETVPSAGRSAQTRIRPEAPEGPIAIGVALCLRNRTLLAVPDTRRSPLIKANGAKDIPRSVMFVPMFAQNELLGVMQIAYAREHRFGHEEQAATQHLANQVATALRLQDQKTIREQLFRSERLAAGGQLISGIAAELRSPLSSILASVETLKKRNGAPDSSAVDSIRSEAARASEIVARLLSFSKIGQMEAQPVDLNALLLGLLRFRSQERKQKGIEILPQILNRRIMVLGSQGQLEQAFLNLLVHAEQAAAEAREIAMSISTSLLAKRVLIEIGFHFQTGEMRKTDPFSDTETEGGVLGLGLCRAIIHSHGGEIRLVRVSPTLSRFEVELPVIESGQSPSVGRTLEAPPGERVLTFVVVEPDAAVCNQLSGLLSNRGHRVVPVSTAEEATDLSRRLKFDAAACSTRLAGSNWIDFYERVRHHVDTFLLLTDGYDADLVKAFQGGDGFVLSKPLDIEHFNRILGVIEKRESRFGGAW